VSGSFVGIAGWQKNSFIDFPGTVSAVLFYCGCNLRCPYCHNPALANGSLAERVAPEEIRGFLEKRRGQVDGVTLSGGEPTLQQGLAHDAATIRSMGYRLKLDTNGLLPEVVKRIKPDYLALDVKTRPAHYRQLLQYGRDDAPERLAQSIAMVREMGERAEVRITVAPGLVDREVVAELAEVLAGVRRVFLQRMDQRYPLLDPAYNIAKPVGPEELRAFQGILAQAVGECLIRGA
jgi:pyruvate formate lyase activating enzyme